MKSKILLLLLFIIFSIILVSSSIYAESCDRTVDTPWVKIFGKPTDCPSCYSRTASDGNWQYGDGNLKNSGFKGGYCMVSYEFQDDSKKYRLKACDDFYGKGNCAYYTDMDGPTKGKLAGTGAWSIYFVPTSTDEESSYCSFHGGVWAGAGGSMNCCDPGDFFVFSNNKKLCSNSLIYECGGTSAIPVTVGQSVDGVLCQESGFPAMPTNCVLGTNEGADQGTSSCCSFDENSQYSVYDSIIGQDSKCYAKSSITADKFEESCISNQVRGSWLLGTKSIPQTEGNYCCGDDKYEIIKTDFEEMIANSHSGSVYLLKNYDENWDTVTYARGTMTATWNSEDKKSGENSLEMTFNAADGRLMSKPIYFLPGNYTLSFYAKTENFVDTSTYYPNSAHDPSRRTNIILVGGTDAWPRIFKEGNKLSRTTDWHKEQMDFEVKTPITAYINMPGGAWSTVSGKLWIDEFKLVRKTGSDLGNVEGDYVCTREVIGDLEKWSWKSPTSAPYQIVRASDQFDILSNSAKWFSCSPGNVLDWVDNPVSGALTEEPSQTYTFEEGLSGSATYNFQEPGTVEVGQQELPQENIFEGIEGELTPIAEEPVFSGKDYGYYSAYIQPKIISNGILSLRIKKPGAVFEIRNEPHQRIKIGQTGNDGKINWDLYAVKHENAVSANGVLRINARLPSTILPGNYHINVTLIEGSSIKHYFAENAFSVAHNFIAPDFNPFNVYPQRFFCSFKGGNSENQDPYSGFTECCGPSYSSCFNRKEVSRIAGGPVSLIKDYGTPLSGNVVLRVTFPADADYELYQYSTTNFLESPLPITKWSEYDNLEFDILFTGSKTQNLRLKITDTEDNVLFDELAIRYSVSGNAFNKWHHVVIPLSPELKSSEIGDMIFYAKGEDLKKETGEDCGYCQKMNGALYRMIFGVDRFFLSVNNPTDATPQNIFCASDYSDYKNAKKVGKWIDDMDKNMDSCNNVASFRWTAAPYETDGKQINCCGDDQKVKWKTFCQQNSDCKAPLVCKFFAHIGKGICMEVNSITISSQPEITSELVVEENFYNDEGACWNGMYIENDTVVDVSVEISGLCGDGIKTIPEQCDDGNTVSGDGCSNCMVEAGWTCSSGTPSACTMLCGNGIKESPEECDDGNKASGDGCNKNCLMQSFDTSCANGMLDFYPDPDNSATPFEPQICSDFCKHTNFIAGGIGNMMIKHNIFQVIFQYPLYSLYTSIPPFQNGLYLGYGTPDGQNTGAMHCRCYNLKEAGESCSSGTCNAVGVCV